MEHMEILQTAMAVVGLLIIVIGLQYFKRALKRRCGMCGGKI